MIMNKLPPIWRIYLTGKPYKHLGNVEANTASEALEKAVKGSWKLFLLSEVDKPITIDNLVAQL